MKLSIRSKILLGFIIVLLLSYTTQIISFNVTSNNIRIQTRSILNEHADSAASQIENFTAAIELDQLGIAREFARSTPGQYDRVTQTILYTIQQNRFIEKITVVSRTGRELIKADRTSITPAENLYFEFPTPAFDASLAGQTAFSKVYYDEKTKTPYVDVYTPIVATGGTVSGAIKGQIQLAQLWDIIAQVQIGEEGFAFVVDEEGQVIAHPKNELITQGANYASREVVADLLGNDAISFPTKNYDYTNETNVNVVATSQKIPKLHWIVVVEQPEAEAYAQLSLARNLFYITFLGTLVLLLLISFYLSDSFASPIQKLTSFTNLLTQGNLDIKVDIRSGDELERLAKAFNLMATRLKSSINELRSKVQQLEIQKSRLNQSAKLLLRRDLDLRVANEELEKEKETAEAERNKLEIILAGIHDAVIAVDLEHRIILFNDAAQQLTGFRSNEVLGRPLESIINLADKEYTLPVSTYCPIRTDDYEGIVFQKENLKLSSSRKSGYVNLIAGQIKEGNSINLGAILTLHDVTTENELERMKLDFVSMAAHELRTPLTSLRGYLSFLIEDASDKLDQTGKDYLDRAILNSGRLNELIENLLAVSKIEQGKMTINPQPSNLLDTIQRTVDDFVDYARSKNLEIRFHRPESGVPQVLMDSIRIEEVLTNLIGNAIHYSEKGHIDINIIPQSDYLVTSVRDTGIGIPATALPHLFTKFFRIQSQLESGSKGTGLGLYISKSIIEAHGGKIWVESKEGIGTAFFFSLPVASSPRDQVS